MAGLRAVDLSKTRSPHRGNHRKESISSLSVSEIFQIRNKQSQEKTARSPGASTAGNTFSSSSSFLPHLQRNKKLSGGKKKKVVTSDEASCHSTQNSRAQRKEESF